jgi:preprotein translocase subunit SecY
MKNLIQTIRNIFKIEDLRTRILNTLFFLLIYRLGTHIVLPGVDPQSTRQLCKTRQKVVYWVCLDMFSGGAFSHCIDLCIRYHALHLCIDRDPAS